MIDQNEKERLKVLLGEAEEAALKRWRSQDRVCWTYPQLVGLEMARLLKCDSTTKSDEAIEVWISAFSAYYDGPVDLSENRASAVIRTALENARKMVVPDALLTDARWIHDQTVNYPKAAYRLADFILSQEG